MTLLVTNVLLRSLCIAAVLLAVFWFRPAAFRAVLRRVSSAWNVLARRPVISILAVALLPLAVRLAILPLMPIPVPRIHDEFSYLLAADTFAHGRLTNPPHPMWRFFETFHVLQQPTYMSKYPPAQALFLAIGQVVFGHPWWGVVLSIGIMCGAACWALQAWQPPNWALLGGVGIAVQFGITNYWMNSYWGGAPAAIGGCLVLGAFGRLKQIRSAFRHPAFHAIVLALGIGLLINSRPWEGVALTLPLGIALAYHLVWGAKGTAGTLPRRLLKVALPCGVALALVAAAMGFYSWRVTGNPLSLPYRVCHLTYSVAPLFLWESRTPAPAYRHAVMKRFYLEVEPAYQDANTLGTFHGWFAVEQKRLRMIKDLLFGNFFLLLCAALSVYLLRDAATRVLIVVLVAAVAALSVESWCQPHYLGPVIVAAAAVKLTALRYLSSLKLWGKRIGLAFATAVVAFSAVNLVSKAAADRPSTASFQFQRAAIQKELESAPGFHVVLVRYSNEHISTQEWVYNAADIDRAKIVWAREMSPAENRQLLAYYRNRTVWLLEPDTAAPDIRPYPVPPLNGLVSTAPLTLVSGKPYGIDSTDR